MKEIPQRGTFMLIGVREGFFIGDRRGNNLQKYNLKFVSKLGFLRFFADFILTDFNSSRFIYFACEVC